jgi:hypothetical protein
MSLIKLILDVAVFILGDSVAPLVALLVVELVRANQFYFSCKFVGETNRTCALAWRGKGIYLGFFGDFALFERFFAVFTFFVGAVYEKRTIRADVRIVTCSASPTFSIPLKRVYLRATHTEFSHFASTFGVLYNNLFQFSFTEQGKYTY